jgi:hypothetical protein
MRTEPGRRRWCGPGCRAGAAALLAALALAGPARAADAPSCALSTLLPHPLWTGDMADWHHAGSGAVDQFGAQNLQAGPAGLQAAYPRGSYDPAAVRTAGAPLGGAQFRTPFAGMRLAVGDEVGIRYQVAFADNFRFVRGGKLPGLYGGTANSGGKVPDGRDGFSLRFVWQAEGRGALSAYLPTSGKWGTLFGLGRWRFAAGQGTELALVARMNTPGLADGVIAAWADDVLVLHVADVVFRTQATLRPDGFFFSTFFGGGTPDWATPVDTFARFGRLSVFLVDLDALGRCAAGRADLQRRQEIR